MAHVAWTFPQRGEVFATLLASFTCTRAPVQARLRVRLRRLCTAVSGDRQASTCCIHIHVSLVIAIALHPHVHCVALAPVLRVRTPMSCSVVYYTCPVLTTVPRCRVSRGLAAVARRREMDGFRNAASCKPAPNAGHRTSGMQFADCRPHSYGLWACLAVLVPIADLRNFGL